MRVAIVVERLPFDKLHDEIGQAVFGGAAVEETRDVWMIERGEDLALGAKATQDEIGIHAALHQLDSDAHVEFFVYTNRLVDGAHAAASNFALNAIRTETAADHRVFVVEVFNFFKRSQRV